MWTGHFFLTSGTHIQAASSLTILKQLQVKRRKIFAQTSVHEALSVGSRPNWHVKSLLLLHSGVPLGTDLRSEFVSAKRLKVLLIIREIRTTERLARDTF